MRSYKRVAFHVTPIMRLGDIHTTCQLEVICVLIFTRGASELEILSISKSKSIRVISKTYKSHIYALYVQSYLYILEDESVTLGDEFLSVDQSSSDFNFFMSQLGYMCITKRNDLIKSL